MPWSIEQQLLLLEPGRFEELCARIVKGIDPHSYHLDGSGGDEGIDIYSGDLGPARRTTSDSALTVWQVKYFRNGIRAAQKIQIRKSLDRALTHGPSRWILCVPCRLTISTARWWEKFTQDVSATYPSLKLEIWTGDSLVDLIPPSLRADYFNTTGSIERFATVPPLPFAFIERPEISTDLREKLLASSVANVAVTAVQGMGGVGKTMVTLGLCHAPVVRDAFRDGIIWLTVGREQKLTFEDRVKLIAAAMNDAAGVYTQSAYRSLFVGKRALLVLDDVWQLDDVEPFLLPSGTARLIFTTRNKTLAAALGTPAVDVGVLNISQSRQFLSNWSGRPADKLPEPEASQIIVRCQGLPLGLSMIGAALRGHEDSQWTAVLSDIEHAELDQLAIRPAGYAYETLHAAIAASVNSLDSDIRDCYLRLAVLAEDMPAPISLLVVLWGQNERRALQTVRLLVSRSMATQHPEGIRIHDLQHDYLKGEHPYPEALALERWAIQRSSHVILRQPDQVAGQLTGLLLAYSHYPGVPAFLEQIGNNAPRPWLRPVWPTLTSTNPIRRVLAGHDSAILGIAISGLTNRAISASHDQTLMVWDLDGHHPPTVLVGHTAPVTCAALSPDGGAALSGGRDGRLFVWKLGVKVTRRTIRTHKSQPIAVNLSREGDLAMAAYADGTVVVWDFLRLRVKRTLSIDTTIESFAFCESGWFAISGHPDGSVALWDLKIGRIEKLPQNHTSSISAVAIHGDGNLAVSGSSDGRLVAWSTRNMSLLSILRESGSEVNCVGLSPDSHYLACGLDSGDLALWDFRHQQEPIVYRVDESGVYAVSFTRDGRRLLCAGDDKVVVMLDLEWHREPRLMTNAGGCINAMAGWPTGHVAVSGSTDGTVSVWDLDNGECRLSKKMHHDSVAAVALVPGHRLAVSGSEDRTLTIWDLESGDVKHVLKGHETGVNAVAVNADGTRIISGADNGELIVWDGVKGRRLRTIRLEVEEPINAIGLTADGATAVLGIGGAPGPGAVLNVNITARKRTQVVAELDSAVNVLTLTDGGERALVGTYRNVFLLSSKGNQPVTCLESHEESVWAIACSADRRFAASVGHDNRIVIWDLAGRKPVAIFEGDVALTACTWQGDRIFVGDLYGGVYLFEFVSD